ncbi:neopullulanase [Acetivibrio straminisolvens JCM 21531]|uniref:Neopullulanase n=1 Tax=Acetivibrio straminisolvens JCM 21531 TaxID=1294263 RepID=W4V2K4_9FIRM|nr:neopullulanase [Acetivibrio straminisolvens JCM 21531]
MPKFNTSNPETTKYLLDVVKYWTVEFGVDGWRLDAADEVDRKFWRKLRDMLKDINKDVVLVGEIFDEASSWLWGDQFDSVMNYPLKAMINDLFAYRSIDTEIFRMRINSYIMKLHKKVLNSLVNIISTHDTPRFLTLCDGDEKRFELQRYFNLPFRESPSYTTVMKLGWKAKEIPIAEGQ